ncbi:hypothetical protein C1645_824560 [Glomus cerebriforme]|uniref:Uncharacterized protein n=1 Tax=Glomus cerebriforme TaxID=658196 RepID=A0A397STZ1_9GLOM|nr:hypothetical protein C1645_824560 [Glomus cerebriforme]
MCVIGNEKPSKIAKGDNSGTDNKNRHVHHIDVVEYSFPSLEDLAASNFGEPWSHATVTGSYHNIDFKEKTFKFGNIYDVTHDSSHATLRIVFQVHLPFEVENSPELVVGLTIDTPLFGINQNINEILMIFQQTIDELLDFRKINNELIYKEDFDADTIKRAILSKLNPGCLGPSPDIVILEPGANPNSDEEILRVAEMYKEDFSMEDHSFLNIVADEAIYRRLIRCREKWPKIRPILGAWHTSKDFCSHEYLILYGLQ